MIKERKTIDLIVEKDGTSILMRDVIKGEWIVYQNNYLKSINKTDIAKVEKDIPRFTNLRVGCYEEGETVITANLNSEDCLIIKKIDLPYGVNKENIYMQSDFEKYKRDNHSNIEDIFDNGNYHDFKFYTITFKNGTADDFFIRTVE